MELRKSIVVIILITLPLPALGQIEEGFDPGFLVADESFADFEAFGSAEGVQRFLEVRGSVLANPQAQFSRKLKEPADIALKNRLEDPNPNLGRLRTAAELIYDAAQLGKINPQVLLATLQKEQSLIDGQFPDEGILQRRLDRAMGFACPDSGTCSDLFLGFYFQLFGNVDREGNRYLGAARSMSRNFYFEVGGVRVGRGPLVDAAGNAFGGSPKVRTAQAGDTITVENTQGPPYYAAPTQQVTLKNAAAAALYRYTPHVFNGNYNFWRFYHQWFKYPNGSLIKVSGTLDVFYVDNGQRRPVSGTVLTLRNLDVTRAFILSQRELDSYSQALPLPPPEGSLVSPSLGGVRYLVEESQLRKISDFTATLHKLDLNQTIYLPEFEVEGYEQGLPAPPPDGTLIRARGLPVVYLVQEKKLRPISGFVFSQRGFKFSSVVVAADEELKDLAKSDPLPPLDGTLVKSVSSSLVYYVALGQKFPVPFFVFKLRGFKFSSVVILGDDEIDHLVLAEHLAPLDGTLIKAKGIPTVYLVEAGSLHYISGFIFKQRGYKFSSVAEVTQAELTLLPVNAPLFLDDGTLIKVKADLTVYLLEEGQKRPLTLAAFNARGFKFANVIEVPSDESERYPTGPVIGQ